MNEVFVQLALSHLNGIQLNVLSVMIMQTDWEVIRFQSNQDIGEGTRILAKLLNELMKMHEKEELLILILIQLIERKDTMEIYVHNDLLRMELSMKE